MCCLPFLLWSTVPQERLSLFISSLGRCLCSFLRMLFVYACCYRSTQCGLCAATFISQSEC